VCRVAEFFKSPAAQRRFPYSNTGRYTNTCILQRVAGFTLGGAAVPLQYVRFERVYQAPVRYVSVQPTGAKRKLSIETLTFSAVVSKCTVLNVGLVASAPLVYPYTLPVTVTSQSTVGDGCPEVLFCSAAANLILPRHDLEVDVKRGSVRVRGTATLVDGGESSCPAAENKLIGKRMVVDYTTKCSTYYEAVTNCRNNVFDGPTSYGPTPKPAMQPPRYGLDEIVCSKHTVSGPGVKIGGQLSLLPADGGSATWVVDTPIKVDF
jgi:hypothetical protein